MLDDADNIAAGLAALVLFTSRLAVDLREQRISGETARAIFNDAHALLRDRAGFGRAEQAIARAADDFLSVAEALAQPGSPRVPDENCQEGRLTKPCPVESEGP